MLVHLHFFRNLYSKIMKNLKLNIISILLCLSLTAVAQNKKEDFYFSLEKQPLQTFLEIDSADTTTWKLIKKSQTYYIYNNYDKYLYKNGKLRYQIDPFSRSSHPNESDFRRIEFIFDPLKHKKVKISSQDLKKIKVYKDYDNMKNKKFRKCLKYLRKNKLTKGKPYLTHHKLNHCFNVYMIEKINDNEYWKYEIDWNEEYGTELSISVVTQNKKGDLYFNLKRPPVKTFLEIDSANTTTWKLIKENPFVKEKVHYNKYLYKNGEIIYYFNPNSLLFLDYIYGQGYFYSGVIFVFDPLEHKKAKISSQDLKKIKAYKHYEDVHDKKFQECIEFLEQEKLYKIQAYTLHFKLSDCFNVYQLEKINDNEYWKYEVNWNAKYKD